MLACLREKRSPCSRSGQGAVDRPEWEGSQAPWWRAAAGGPGHVMMGQAQRGTRFGRHRPLKITESRVPLCGPRC